MLQDLASISPRQRQIVRRLIIVVRSQAAILRVFKALLTAGPPLPTQSRKFKSETPSRVQHTGRAAQISESSSTSSYWHGRRRRRLVELSSQDWQLQLELKNIIHKAPAACIARGLVAQLGAR